MALLTGTLHRVASDAKRWSGDATAAMAASADGQKAVADGLAAADKGSVTLGTAMHWQLRELAARLQLQRAKFCLAQVRQTLTTQSRSCGNQSAQELVQNFSLYYCAMTSTAYCCAQGDHSAAQGFLDVAERQLEPGVFPVQSAAAAVLRAKMLLQSGEPQRDAGAAATLWCCSDGSTSASSKPASGAHLLRASPALTW